jgi:hypothetical protein
MKFFAFLREVLWRVATRFGFARPRSRYHEPSPDSPNLFGPIPLRPSTLGPSEPERPIPPRGRAPEPAPESRSGSFRPERDHTTLQHPILVRLRRRAFNQLFDHFDLSMIPAEAWFALDRSDDPVAAFTRL